MKVKELIAKLQKLDPELETLVSDPDGGLPYTVGDVYNDVYDEDVNAPIALIFIIN